MRKMAVHALGYLRIQTLSQGTGDLQRSACNGIRKKPQDATAPSGIGLPGLQRRLLTAGLQGEGLCFYLLKTS